MALSHPLVYLAGPIDDTDGVEPWRENARDFLRQRAIGVYDPAGAFSVPTTHLKSFGPAVSEINREAIKRSDLMLAHLNDGRPFGTIREIEHARQWCGIPVIVSSVVLSLEAWDLECVPSLTQALNLVITRIEEMTRFMELKGNTYDPC